MGKKNCRIVAYYRVSTPKQGQSGLGVEGQQAAVSQYVDCSGCELVAEYCEVESSHRDNLDNRPQLRAAIRHAKRAKAILCIAKLDRLARSVYVTAELMRSGVEFVCCDNPDANRLTIQILAVVAENESVAISSRTKAALAAYKARGGKLGTDNLTDEGRAKGGRAAGKLHARRADEAYSDEVYPLIRSLTRKSFSLSAIADELNRTELETMNGGKWSATQVSRELKRLERHGQADRTA